MWDEIMAWEQAMMGQRVTERTRLQYSQDARRFAAWVYQHTPYRSIADITISDSWKYWHVLTVGRMRQLPLEDRAYHALIAYWEAMDALPHTPIRREKHHTEPHGNGVSTRAFIGQRGPFTERTIRLTFAQIGQSIHRQHSLTPSHVQASFLMWIFAPRAYGCTWDGTLLTVIDDALHQSSLTRGEEEDYDLQWFVGVVQDAFRQDT